jgi:hypothetical protein
MRAFRRFRGRRAGASPGASTKPCVLVGVAALALLLVNVTLSGSLRTYQRGVALVFDGGGGAGEDDASPPPPPAAAAARTSGAQREHADDERDEGEEEDAEDAAPAEEQATPARGSACGDDLTAAESAVRKWVAAARNAYVPPGCTDGVSEYALAPPDKVGCDRFAWHGRPMFASVWETSIPCAVLPPDEPATAAGDVLLSVMVLNGSSLLRHAVDATQTWVPQAAALGGRVQFVVDAPTAAAAPAAALEVLRTAGEVVTLPDGGDGVGADPRDARAQLPLRALRHVASAARALPPAQRPRWHFLVPDDTYVNLDEAVAAVAFYNYRLPLLVGHVDAGKAVQGYGNTDRPDEDAGKVRHYATRPAGPAGVLLSAAAVAALGPAVLTPACPWPGAGQERAQRWDFALGRCCWLAGVPQMPSPLMLPSLDNVQGKAWHMDRNQPPLEAAVSVSASAGGRYSYLRTDKTDPTVDDTLLTIHAALRLKRDPTLFIHQRTDL